VEVLIRDDGVGFCVPRTWAQAAGEGHLGWSGMKERVEILGGSVQVHSDPGRGTRVLGSLPLHEAAGDAAAPAA
jgi:signal transduction histidine kinase